MTTTRRTFILNATAAIAASSLPGPALSIDKAIADILEEVKSEILSQCSVARVIGSWGEVLGESKVDGFHTWVPITKAGEARFLRIFDSKDNELVYIQFDQPLLPDDTVHCNLNNLDLS